VRGQRPEHWAHVDPDRPAVVGPTRTLSYGQWNDHADRLAEALTRLRLPAPVAAVRLAPGPDWFVVNLALAKLGWQHVAVPTDVSEPHLDALLADTGAAVLFHDGDDSEPGPGRVGRNQLSAMLDGSRPVPRSSRSDAPLLLHTSGTTGPRRSIARDRDAGRLPDEDGARVLREYQREVAEVTPVRLHNRTLLTMPLHHGTGPAYAHRALSMAGTLYLEHPYDPRAVLATLDTHRITHWTAVPWMLHQLRALPAEVLDAYDASSLEALSIGGAMLSPVLRQWVNAYVGEDRLYEFYGATEVGVVASMPPWERPLRPESCGRPHRHVEVRVVGPDGRPVPVGEEGELLVRTPQAEGDADGFARVGDVGWLDAEGYLHLRGRTRDVIARGENTVHAADVERALSGHPSVLDVAVVGLPDGADRQEVVAFCELLPAASLDAGALGDLLGAMPPSHRPDRVEVVDRLPRNSIGKVVKGPLREPGYHGRPVLTVAPSPAAPPFVARRSPSGSVGWRDPRLLDRAWRAVRLEAETDPVPDPERYRRVALDWERCRDRLVRDGYRPHPVRVVPAPKTALVHRPVPVLHPLDRVAYVAMVSAMEPAIAGVLGPEVYPPLGVAGSAAPTAVDWLDFEQAARELGRETAGGWAVTTDIASFFQSVDTGVLADDLKSAGAPADIVADLTNFLDTLCGSTGVWGLPHDQNASSTLGSLYLAPADAVLRQHGIGFVRLQDDIRMAGPSPQLLTRAVAELEREIGRRRLALSSGKTALLPGREMLAGFVRRGLTAREQFDLTALAEASVADPAGRAREIRFALVRLAGNEDGYAVDWVLENLASAPYLAVNAGRYLRAVLPRVPDLARRIGTALVDAGTGLHPFAVLHLLRVLRDAPDPVPEAQPLAWQLLADADAEFYVRQQAARYLGRHAPTTQARRLRALAGDIADSDVGRVVLAAAYRLRGGGPENDTEFETPTTPDTP
jgi:long-chain acyl-CoA synthetase